MTWTLKVRTSPGAPMTAEYECPEHGRFEATVERDANGDPPAETPCRVLESGWVKVDYPSMTPADPDDPAWLVHACGIASPWRISCGAVHTQFVISATQGKSAPKPHPKSMDTRMIAEGRKNDFRKQRRKIREDERHRRVKELLR